MITGSVTTGSTVPAIPSARAAIAAVRTSKIQKNWSASLPGPCSMLPVTPVAGRSGP